MCVLFPLTCTSSSGRECEGSIMAWSGGTSTTTKRTPYNTAFSHLRNMQDGDLSSSEECLVYTPGSSGGKGGSSAGSFVPASSIALPTNHQANKTQTAATPLSAGTPCFLSLFFFFSLSFSLSLSLSFYLYLYHHNPT